MVFPISPPDTLIERMKKDKCFFCGVEGHWTRYCPNKTPKTKEILDLYVVKDYDVPVVYCGCNLACVVKEINGSKRFCCSRGKPNGCGRMEYFDKVQSPQCTCGAGAASVRKWMKVDKNMGRIYYACRVKKGHGACSFFEWKDSKKSSPANDCADRSNNDISIQSAIRDIQMTDTVDKGKGMRVEFSPPHPKRLKFDCLDTDDTHHLEGTSIVQMETGKHLVEDSASALLVKDADILATSANIPSRAVSGAEVIQENLKFPSVNCAAGRIILEGRREFGGFDQPVYTPCSLSACQAQPFSSCEVPNYNATGSKSTLAVSKSSTSFTNLIAGSSSRSQGQESDNSKMDFLLTRKQTGEPLVLQANPSATQEKAVACLKETFSSVLESMDPFDISSTIQKAERIISALACLGVDTNPLCEQVNIVSRDLKKKAETFLDAVTCLEGVVEPSRKQVSKNINSLAEHASTLIYN